MKSLTVILSLCLGSLSGQYRDRYNNQRRENQRAESYERYLLDSPYNLCREPLFFKPTTNVTATSYWHDR